MTPEPASPAPLLVPAALDQGLPPMHHKTVLVIDLVESVRLMGQDEQAVVRLWRGFVQHASTEVLPAHQGRLVKSLGDGLLVEFQHPGEAVRAALRLHRYFDAANHGLPAAQQMHLRAGINATQLYIDDTDIYGQGVNLAARVADLAAPGETVITASVFDAIVVGVDGEVQDRGESYLKHWPEPVRTWTVWPVKHRSDGGFTRAAAPEPAHGDFRPSIAVVPFETRSHAQEQFVIGELLADGVITQLSRSPELRVISRLSTSAFRGRQASASEVGQRLEAGYTLSGSYLNVGDKVVISAELSDNRRAEVIWAERLAGEVMDLLQTDSALIQQLSEACARALLQHVVQRTMVLPVPQLDSNALMLGGITLMHRSTPRDLQRSQQLLEAVTERHKRVATPWAWMAKWSIMQVVQGLAPEPAQAFRQAISLADRALDLEPHSSLAMAIKGHALCHLGSDVQAARDLLHAATEANPNDAMAWLYRCVWSTMWGNTADAVPEAGKALALSPLDPQRYYFEMMLAASHLGANQLPQAVDLGESSLRKNRYHLPTIRTLMTAHYELDHIERARELFALVKQLQPALTLSTYLQTGSVSPMRQRTARVLSALGLD